MQSAGVLQQARRISILCVVIGSLLLTLLSRSPAQTVAEAQKSDSIGAAIPVEVFQPPRVKRRVLPEYPLAARSNYEEGWVELSFMVSQEGKPYEVYVSQSVGSKEFERSALRTIEDWTFEPAVLNGQTIDSAVCMKMKFELDGGLKGAQGEFINWYRAFTKAIDENNRAGADAARAKLHVTNLYEDSYLGLAEYRYATRWGDEAQQTAGLHRAIASESTAHYLPKSLFVSALRDLLRLQVAAQNFSDALSTWETLLKAGVDQNTFAQIKPTIDRIEALRTDDRAYYEVPGRIVESSWSYRLFKNRFRFDVSEGKITDVKVLCEKKYVAFKFDAELDYRVSDRFGRCSLAISGEPGTQFKLIQH